MSGNFFDKYPYTDFHELNLDWILKKIKDTEKKVDDFTIFNNITWAGIWSATKSYVKWAIVQDENGNGFLSLQPVPANVSLSDRNYWVEVANYDALFTAYNDRLTSAENSITKNSDDLSELNKKVQINNGNYCNIKAVVSQDYGTFIYDAWANPEAELTIYRFDTARTPRDAIYRIPEAMLSFAGCLNGPLVINNQFYDIDRDEALYYVGYSKESGFKYVSLLTKPTANEILSLGNYGCSCWSPIVIDGVKWQPTQEELNSITVSKQTFNEDVYSNKEPRSVMGIDEDNQIHFINMTGRFAQYEGATYDAMYDYCIANHIYTAFNMDGGSSMCLFAGKRRISPSQVTKRRLMRHFWRLN